jgi:hypothetical protein
MRVPTKKRPGATLAGATGREDYGAAYRLLRFVQRLPDGLCKAGVAVSLWIEQRCSRIETKRELSRWNRNLEENP